MNNGLRFITERRSGMYHRSFTDLGELHQGNRGHDTPMEGINEADQYRRQLELGRWQKSEKAKRLAERQ